MPIQPETAEQIHIDQAIARARLFARLLNETLDELAGHQVECVGVSMRHHDAGSIDHNRRVELLLLFKAAPTAP